MDKKRTKVTKKYLIAGFLSVLLFSSDAFAAKTVPQKDNFLDSLETINVETALKELEEVEGSLADEISYYEGGEHIPNSELEGLLSKILTEESSI
jgi:hypothetical protein